MQLMKLMNIFLESLQRRVYCFILAREAHAGDGLAT